MKCEETYDSIEAHRNGGLDEHEMWQLKAHLETCDDCRAAAYADAALQRVRAQSAQAPPAGLFERIMRRSRPGDEAPARSRFWVGSAVGAALAASLMVAIIGSGLFDPAPETGAARPAFQVALGKPRNVNIAIEMDRDLANAVITVTLSGGIELDGYAGRRELSWASDLKAGVNKLSLPIVAIDEAGGRLLVRVDHDGKERHFAMNLGTES